MYVIDSSVIEHLERVMRRVREKLVFKEAWRSYDEFIERFPFRRRPEKIEELTPEDVYNPGADKPRRDFFYYVEKKLKPLGHITVYNDYAWRRAREDLATFKELLKILVDDDERICRKIDSWDRLKGFGGDKHYAKKLLFLYYPEEVIPIFKTEHLEHFAAQLGLTDTVDDRCRELFGKSISSRGTSVGEKYEVYQGVFMEAFREVVRDREDSHALGVALYSLYPPTKPVQPAASTTRSVGEPIGEMPILFEPVNELGVVMIFGMIYKQLGFPYIVKVRQGFPDASVIDEDGEIKRIEFEYKASNFLRHRHDPSQCDFIICWENDLGDSAPDEIREKVIAIKDRLRELL